MTKTSKAILLSALAISAITATFSCFKTTAKKNETIASKTPDNSSEEEPKEISPTEKKVAEESKTDNKLSLNEPKRTPAIVKEKAKNRNQPLTINIQNLASSSASVYISIYGVKNKFPDPKGQLKEYKFKPHGSELTVEIPNLKFGTYAVASYQDVNMDGKIGKNFIGIPTEGYAFSNNYKPTIKAPKFDDCSFEYNAKINSITIKMIQ